MALRNMAEPYGLGRNRYLVTLVSLALAACSTQDGANGSATDIETTDDSSATDAGATPTTSPRPTTSPTPTTSPASPGNSTVTPVTPSANDGSHEPNSPTSTSSHAPTETSPLDATSDVSSPASSAPPAAASETESEVSLGPTTPTTSSSAPEPNPGNCQPTTDETRPVGYGANTTGGGAAAPVVVTSFAEAEAALAAYRDAFKDGTRSALVLRYTGSFDYATIKDVCAQHEKDAQTLYIKEVDNVTFEGAPGSSANFGIKINRAKNVIVRNMTIGLLPGGGDSDAITIEGNGTNGDVEHVWIDHNNLFSDTKDDCDGAGDTEFDGLIDIKKGARYITLSYNHLHDHQKTGLLGSSDSDDMDRYVTFHHNWYENVVSRTPLHRFGYIHLFNNYFDRIHDSGINVRMGGVALIEANYFENAANPVTSRYSDVVGYWDLRDNHVGPNVTWTLTEDTLANADDWQSTTTFPASELTYQYDPDAADCVKAIVTARAGATL